MLARALALVVSLNVATGQTLWTGSYTTSAVYASADCSGSVTNIYPGSPSTITAFTQLSGTNTICLSYTTVESGVPVSHGVQQQLTCQGSTISVVTGKSGPPSDSGRVRCPRTETARV